MLNPLDFSALNDVSICHRSLYNDCASSGLLNDTMICSSGIPSLFLILDADK